VRAWTARIAGEGGVAQRAAESLRRDHLPVTRQTGDPAAGADGHFDRIAAEDLALTGGIDEFGDRAKPMLAGASEQDL
jgi:hypothetical protein